MGVTLDPRPTWKPHLEVVENKSIRRLYHMKKFAGTKWGASLKIPRQVYTGNVRPVAEYASSWSTSSKANKTRIDKVLNMGLRIIHGAIKSTAVWQMEKMVNIQPLETRRNFKVQCQAEKAKIPLPHPLHQKLNQPIESRLQRKLLNHKVKELKKRRQPYNYHIEQLCPRVWLPIQRFEVSTKISGIHSKADHLPHMLKALTLETLDHKYPICSWIYIFPDVSAERAVKMEEAE